MVAVSIIIPTYNEAENIDLLLERIFAVEDLQCLDYEVVFSDGASTDGTCKFVEKWLDNDRIKLVCSKENEGLSAAVMAGARAAAGEFAVVMDADLSHPPEMIPALVAPLISGACDMAIGSRYTTGGDTPEWPISRRVSSKIATFPARMWTDVKDPLAGFIAVRRERLASMNRQVCGFKIGLELLATGEDDLRVKEIPIIFRDRCYGTSKMGVKVMIDYCRQLLMLAGVNIVPIPSGKLLPLLLTVLIMDCTILTMSLEGGIRPGLAHWLSFIPASSLGAAVLIYLHRKSLPDISARRRLEYLIGFFWVVFLVLLLRSGLVASLGSEQKILTTAEVFWVALFGLAAVYVGNVGYVFSIGQKRIRGPLVQRFYGLGVFLYLIFLRLVYLGSAPVLPEERYYQDLIAMWPLFNQAGTAIGHTAAVSSSVEGVLKLRGAIWLLWFLSTTCVFSLARLMFDRGTAFMCCLLFAVLPFFFGSGLFVSGDALLVFCWSCTLYILYRTLVNEVNRGWLWAGLALGFGMQVDLRMCALLVAVVVYLLMHTKDRQRLYAPMPYLALGVLLLTTLPSLLLDANSGQPIPQPERWLNSLLGEATVNSFLVIVLLLSPTGLVAGGYALLRWLQSRSAAGVSEVKDWDRGRKFVLMMFFLPLLIFLLPGLYASGPVDAGGVIWVVLLPTMALTIKKTVAAADTISRLLQAVWWPTIGLLMAFYGITLHLAVL